jgi:pectate lyase/ribosomal protein L11
MKRPIDRSAFFSSPKILTLFVFLASLLLWQGAQGALLIDDPFNYTAGVLNGQGTWSSSGSVPDVQVVAGNLAVSGLVASSGNKINFTGAGRNSYKAFTGPASGTIYFSFILRVNATPTAATLFASLNSSSTTKRLCVHLGTDNRVGLSHNAGTVTYGGSALTPGTDYLIVGSLEIVSGNANDIYRLWVSPASSTFGATEPAVDAQMVSTSDTTFTSARFYFQRDAGNAGLDADELRVGVSWAEVTPAGVPLVGTKLGFTTQPASAAPGATISPVVVQVQTSGGAAVASNAVPVTLTMTSGSGTLSGTLTQNSDATGKATFTNLSVDLVGVKQLTAAASGIGAGLTSAVSSNFTIAVPSLASKLAFTTQPTDHLTNAAIPVVVQAQDSSNVNVATNGVPVTITLTTGTGTLAGTATQNTDATGKATFGNLSIDIAGAGKQFTAAAAGLTSALSSTFSITNSTGGGATNPPATNTPVITQILHIPGAVVLSGTNGTPGSNYNVVTSSDLTIARTNWIASLYANYDANGNFTITNPASAILPLQFYRLVTTTSTKLTPPSINQSPVNQTVAIGQTATFNVVASGLQLIYQWYFAGNPLPGQNSATLTINNAQAGNVGNYYVIVANGAGDATSATAALRVGNYAPTITTQPTGQTNYVGGTAIFHIVADGTQPLTYQWYHNNSGTPVANATNTTLTLTNLQLTDAGTYFVTVSGAVAPPVTSTAVNLGVNSAPTAKPNTNMIGFAAVANVTGGAAGSNIFVGDYAALSNAVRRTEPLVIYITNLISAPAPSIDPYLQVLGNNKSFIGVGTNAGLAGGDIKINATNIIIQNLYLPVPPGGTNDGITIDSGKFPAGKYVWIDHCTISNAQDGSIDITKGADYVTISWCKFIYAPKTPSFSHELVNLIGSSDTDFVNSNPFHVTIHHCWYADNAIERMPSVRHGVVHVFNCYYTCAGNNYCARTRIGSQVLVENNYFSGVQNPWELLTTTGTTGLLRATGNNVTGPGDTTAGNSWVNGWYPGQSLIPGTDTLPDLNPPPYIYNTSLDTAVDASFYVPTYSGNGKYPYVP